MAEAFLMGKSGGGGTVPKGMDVTVLAKDQLEIGDVVYTVLGDHDYESDITAEFRYPALLSTVNCVAFSPDGTKLVIGGGFTGRAKIYSVSGTTIAYVSDIYADAGTTALSSNVYSIAFSPDGTKLVIGGAFAGYAKIYSISETTVTYVSDIYADTGATALSSYVNTAVFSLDGNKLVLGGGFSGFAKIYSVSGTTVTFISNIYADAGTTALSNAVNSAVLSSDGTKLVLGGLFAGFAKIYSVSGTTATFVSNVYADAGTTALTSGVYSTALSYDGTKLVIGGGFIGRAKIYSVSGTTVTYASDIYADAGTTLLTSTVRGLSFSPDGTSLVVGGNFAGRGKIYSVSGTTVTYISDIYADTGATALSNSVYAATFAPDGTTLAIVGSFTGNAKIYSVSGTTTTFVSDIYAGERTTALGSFGFAVAFSPDGTKLVLGGNFSGYAKIYSVSGTTITYVSDIYADAGTTALSNAVYSIAFSPDGTKLVLGGFFTGYAKIYSVSGTTVTFASNIYSDAGTVGLSGAVRAVAFSPDGTTLILVGEFIGNAKIYSVSGTTVTFISNIYADAGTTPLNGFVSSVAFSPDGTKLVLGGYFGGYAMIYSVSGTTITFVSYIYADAGMAWLNSYVSSVAFSPDGNKLVLGGAFTGRAKIYSVSGATVTYVSDIYADAGTTGLSSFVYSAVFSPDGNKLVLGGDFTGRAKIYSVSGTTVTYISDIYADAGTTVLGDMVNSVAFSPYATMLIVAGAFTGFAKTYSAFEAHLLNSQNLPGYCSYLGYALVNIPVDTRGIVRHIAETRNLLR